MTLRTNSKKAIANLDNYILSAYHFDGEQAETIQQAAEAIAHNFISQYKCGFNLRYNVFNRFEYWASGLACGGLFDYYCISAVDILGDILEQDKAKRNQYTETEAEAFLTRYIFNRVNKLTDNYIIKNWH